MNLRGQQLSTTRQTAKPITWFITWVQEKRTWAQHYAPTTVQGAKSFGYVVVEADFGPMLE